MAVAGVLAATGVLGMVGGALGQVAPPAAQTGATTPDAGWWNQARPTIALPTGAPPTLPNPGVPAGSLVVSATAGDPSAVTAVAIEREGLEGETIVVATLTLREVADPGANLNGVFAAMEACPITQFWFGGENGEWDTRPTVDCETGRAPGTRAADGTWSFDLTSIAQAWSDGVLDPNGVLLVEAVEAPTSFRTVFAGVDAQAIGIVIEATGGTETTAGPSTSSPPPASSGGTSSGGGGGSGATRAGSVAVPVASQPSGAAAPAAPAVPPTVPVVADLPGPLESLPVSTIGLVLVVAAVAIAAMVALGPDALPATPAVTGRGVSRALARKEHI